MSFRLAVSVTALLIATVDPLCAAGPLTPPWKFNFDEGKRSLTFGFLAQPQFESLSNPGGSGTTNSLFLRRFRLIAGGKVTRKLSFFIESDAANLGKLGPDGQRTTDIYLQDGFLTYAFRPEIQLDAGMFLIATSHNSVQSAASLLPIDYGSYCFLSSAPTHGKYGRDYGIQLRGYLKKHFEYRMAGLRGHHAPNPRFPHRYVLRFAWYPFDVDTGFFYTGTTLAKKRIVSLGAGIDRQNDYSSCSVDFFLDQPVRAGDGVTLQADYIYYDGGTTFQSLPRQNTWMLEGGYYLGRTKLGPFFQLSNRNYADANLADDSKIQGGLAYWANGHKMNVKLGIGRLLKNGSADRTQLVLQVQFFCF